MVHPTAYVFHVGPVLTISLGLGRITGVDVHSGQMPSKLDMFRLLMKTEIRESAMKMAAAFQEAGIDLQSQVGVVW